MVNNLTKFFHADDYGYSESISNNILDCVDSGPINSVSIMINSEDYILNRIKNYKNLNLTLHLNLTSLTNPGNNKNKETLKNLTFSKIFFANKNLKKICKEEIEFQIKKFLKDFNKTNLTIDGHHHIQIIPWVYKHLMSEYKSLIVDLRIPDEKIRFLSVRYLYSLTFYRNLIAVVVLKILCVGRKKFMKKKFAGLLYSGIYNKNFLKKHLQCLENDSNNFEITFHPGFAGKTEIDQFKNSHIKYVTSKNRFNEYSLLKNF